MPPPSRDPESPARRERRRRARQRIDSEGHHRSRRRDEEDSPQASPSKERPKRSRKERSTSRRPESNYSKSASTALSSAQLAQLDQLNRKLGWNENAGMRRPQAADDDEETRAEYDDDREREQEEREKERERRRQEHRERKRRRREEEKAAAAAAAGARQEDEEDEEEYDNPKHKRYRRQERRVASGQALERGSHYQSEKHTIRDDARRRDGSSSDPSYDEEARRRKRKRWICIGAGVFLVVLIVAIAVGVTVSKNSGGGGDSSSDTSSSSGSGPPSNSNLNGVSQSSIPAAAKGTYLDPFDWYDTTDFNVTYTDAKVGGLYVMGLNSTWNDDTKANDNVPALKDKWQYGTMPIRGINIGGWLSIEPFITPSLFSEYSTSDGVVDEWTLSETLGSTNLRTTLEQHYSSWVQESTFAEMQAAGFDHVRIPFSYWVVTTYEGDPYLPMVSWRYLLRAIEWARKYGLRINLDLHGAPGSQNGWNHSGHQGDIGWLNGTDGTTNGQRTIDIHNQLSIFFTQPRYKNIITLYGLVNEPRMTSLDKQTVMTWTQNAITTIQGNGYDGLIIIGDGFMGLDNWQGLLSGVQNVVLDAHQYVIFNNDQIVLHHHDKINFACAGWTSQAKLSMNTNTGFGPTIFGEWSQADTDCAQYLNNVGIGCRWEGTLNMIDTPGGSTSGSVLTPMCPTDNNPRCSCDSANGDPSSYSDGYKQWLLYFAQAQMDSFEYGWGWFYWTWQTESATQWSYKDALANGIMPGKVYDRSWGCNATLPPFGDSDLPEYY
ncbi:hypothetical protein LTR09_008875 [Extremus antarcticus]|uniref:glucan 1,3-beta-glucosidase n=1 Tax=Extremus antarcticus TaxID=702011 RepID=A0AAJ0DHH1_9PEZI|nr:hypothetical protein LTR09_008875 [Extremus antarcticus]